MRRAVWVAATCLAACGSPEQTSATTVDSAILGDIAADAADAGKAADAAGPDGAADVQADAGPVCEILPTLTSLETGYFSSCTFSSCHGAKKPAAALDLTPGHAYAQLLGVKASHAKAAAAGLVRVVAGQPDASFLYQKVVGPVQFGKLMPEGEDTVVDPDCGVAALRQWIADGALDN